MRGYIHYPDGSSRRVELSDLARVRAAQMQELLGGLFAAYPEAYHVFDHYTVWHLDDWEGQERNSPMESILASAGPLFGPVLITALPDGQDNVAEREHQRRFFDALTHGQNPFAA